MINRDRRKLYDSQPQCNSDEERRQQAESVHTFPARETKQSRELRCTALKVNKSGGEHKMPRESLPRERISPSVLRVPPRVHEQELIPPCTSQTSSANF
ncbi:hypothetical protein NL676_034320 [Syzygium grande]|nr:hypothetical protein NL676_034320 [Syzygium grande]